MAALLLWAVIGFWPTGRPSAVPAAAPADQFSAERAMSIVRAIAQQPHPTDSVEHDRVRDWIRAEFSRLGLEPSIETGYGEYEKWGRVTHSNVENIVARMPGTANTHPLMLVAHYDSRPGAPGAGDDASGVATLLETLRALRTGPALRNDIIFLITDAEERGLIGAVVFMRDHPWRNEPGVVLNFEARGTGGPSYMFETSAGNLWLARQLQRAVPAAAASSLSYEVYRRMPNDTDLTVFKRGGLRGMNFAFIEHPEFYHTRFDDPAHLDIRSLQEDGRYALSLARTLGNEDLRDVRSEQDAVYFTTLFTPLIVYPGAWVVPIAWLLTAGLLFTGGIARRRRVPGFWMLVPLAIVAALQLLCAYFVPGASYVLQWPLLAGILGYAVWTFGVSSWRLIVLVLCPAAVTLILLPLLPLFTVALGVRHAWPALVIDVLVALACLAPQLRMVMRGYELPISTPAANTSTPPSTT